MWRVTESVDAVFYEYAAGGLYALVSSVVSLPESMVE